MLACGTPANATPAAGPGYVQIAQNSYSRAARVTMAWQLQSRADRRLRARIYRLFEQLMIKALPSARPGEPGYLCTTADAGNIRICREQG